MADTLCGFPDRDDAIVTYLYDGMDERLRATFDAHLAICGRCRSEVQELADLRQVLAHWEPPDVRLAQPGEWAAAGADPAARPAAGWWQAVPLWARTAAAVLVVGVAAGAANLDVRYDHDGLSIRTGWLRRAAPPASQAAAAGTPWRADLAALEQQMRQEFHGEALAGAGPRAAADAVSSRAAAGDADLLRRVRALEDSDKRQQRELALRVAEVMNNVTAQRNADLLKIDRSLGLLQNNTAAELMKQRGTINYLVSTSQRQ
jgi:hypothetical protein